MSEKLMSFRVDEHLRDEFKLAAAFKRKTMAEILTGAVVKFVEKSLADMAEAQTKRQEKPRKMV